MGENKTLQQFEGKKQTAVVSMTNTGKFFISILVDDEKLVHEKQSFDKDNTPGIDLRIDHFLAISDGVKVQNPRHLKNNLKN